MPSLLDLKETEEARNFVVDTLHKFKNGVKSVASSISAQDIISITKSPGPAVILSIGLPLIGVYLAKKKHDSPLARKVARFLGADVNLVNEQFVFDKLNNPEFYDELKKNILTVITERGDISPLTRMLDLTEGEAWEIFYNIKEIIFSEEVLNQFSIIVPSLKNIEEEIGNVRSNINSLLKALKSPVKVSEDVDDIAKELDVLESAGVSYVRRQEDDEIEQAILNNDNKIIVIIGGPSSGKSKMLYNALMYCKKYFSTFVLMKNYFREGDEKSLDLALDNNDMDKFVIVWDDLDQNEPKFVTDIIERINSIGRSKNFRFIGASIKDIIFVRKQEGVYRVNLQRFDKTAQLVSECAKAFNVKLKPDVTTDKIFGKGDGTPYYTISLFKMFKNREITLKDLDQLPSDVTALWLNYLETSIQNSRINDNQINTFRTIGLLSHASASKTREISKDRIREVYKCVFHGDLGGLDYALDNLVRDMFVSRLNVSYYYAHDSHIEALESKYPIEKHHVQDFVISESDNRNLGAFMQWTLYKARTTDYLDMISSRFIEIDPNDANAWYGKGFALLLLARNEEAIHYYDKAIEINPSHADAWHGKGTALGILGKWEEAFKCAEKATELDRNNADFWYSKGIHLDNLGRYEEALQCYNRALELKPNSFLTLNRRDNVLLKLGKPEQAINYYDKAIEINPNFLEAWYGKGALLLSLGKYEESIICYDKAIEIKPDYASAWYNKGLALYHLNRYGEAIACYDKAIEIKPNEATYWNSKGLAFYRLARYEEAISCYDKAIEINPNFVNTWINKTDALFDLNKYQEAISCYDKAIEIDLSDTAAAGSWYNRAVIWYDKGLAYDSLGKYEEAIKCYDKAIEIDPNSAAGGIVWYSKGLALYRLGKYEEAMAPFDKAIEINPNDAKLDGWIGKGLAYDSLGKYEEAIKCYDKAMEVNQNNAGAWYNRACSNVKQGNIENGLADLKKAIEIDKNNIELAKHEKDFESIRNDERFKALIRN